MFLAECNCDEAMKHYELALKLTEQAFGVGSVQSAPTLSNLGCVHYEKDEDESAIEYSQKALARVWSAVPGRCNHTVAARRLPPRARSKGSVTAVLRGSAANLLEVLGECHNDTAATLGGAAIVLERKQETKKALEYYKRAHTSAFM